MVIIVDNHILPHLEYLSFLCMWARFLFCGEIFHLWSKRCRSYFLQNVRDKSMFLISLVAKLLSFYGVCMVSMSIQSSGQYWSNECDVQIIKSKHRNDCSQKQYCLFHVGCIFDTDMSIMRNIIYWINVPLIHILLVQLNGIGQFNNLHETHIQTWYSSMSITWLRCLIHYILYV